MPLSKYRVRNEYSLADPELYRAADKDDPEALLEAVAMAGFVGLLRQLGDLAEFAAEIFHDLHEEVMATAARGHGLMARVKQLEAEVPSLEKAFFSQTHHSSFYTNGGIDWHPNLRSEQNLVTRGDLPRFIMDSYEECRGPPRLFLLDKFDVAGAGACLKRYTDPSFFKVESISSVTAKVEVQREKRIRKVKLKKGARLRDGEAPNIPSHAKLHQLLLEERIENGYSNPARLVKLKKRQLNGPADEASAGKSYMERFLETPSPDHKRICETSIFPLPVKLTSDDTSEAGIKILEISSISPVKKSLGNKNTYLSPNEQELDLKPFSEIDGGANGDLVKVKEQISAGVTDNMSSNHLKLSDEAELAIDEKKKIEGSLDGYQSDDVTSEVDNYMDALTTMESELETDNEYKSKDSFLNIQKETNSNDKEEHQLQAQFSDSQSFGDSSMSDDNSSFKQDRNEEYVEMQAQSSDSQSTGTSSTSDNNRSFRRDGNGQHIEPLAHLSDSQSVEISSASEENGSFMKDRSNFPPSDSLSTVVENTQSEPILLTNTKYYESKFEDTPSDQLPQNVEFQNTDCGRFVMHDDAHVHEEEISDLGRASLDLTTSQVFCSDLGSTSPGTLLAGTQSDETPSDPVELNLRLDDDDDGAGRTDLVESIASKPVSLALIKDDGCPVDSSDKTSLDNLDDDDPHIHSGDECSDHSQIEGFQAGPSNENTTEISVNRDIGSPGEEPIYPSMEELNLNSGAALVPDCQDSKDEDCTITTQLKLEIPVAKIPPVSCLAGEQFSNSAHNNTQDEPGLAETEVLYSDMQSKCEEIPQMVHDDEINGSTCSVDPVEGDGHFKHPSPDIHVMVNDLVTENHQSDDQAVYSVPSVDSSENDEGIITSPASSQICSPSAGLPDLEEPLSSSHSYQMEIKSNEVESTQMSIDSVAETRENQLAPSLDVASADVIYSPMSNITELEESLSTFADSHKKEVEVDEAVAGDSLTELEEQKIVDQPEVASADVQFNLNELEPCDLPESEICHNIQKSSPREKSQHSAFVDEEEMVPEFSGLDARGSESIFYRQQDPLQNGRDSVSSPTSNQLEPETDLNLLSKPQIGEQDAEFPLRDEKNVASEKSEFQHLQTYQSEQESTPAPSERRVSEIHAHEPSYYSLPQSSSQENNAAKHVMDPLKPILPNLFSKATENNLDEMPPMPPLPPMQWRMGKVQHAFLAPPREELGFSQVPVQPMQPCRHDKKSPFGLPTSERETSLHRSPYLPVMAVESDKLQHSSGFSVGVSGHPVAVPFQFPVMVNESTGQYNYLLLDRNQIQNPFLSLPVASTGIPPHGFFVAPEGEMIQNSNPSAPIPAAAYAGSGHDPIPPQEKSIQPPQQLMMETCSNDKSLQQTMSNMVSMDLDRPSQGHVVASEAEVALNSNPAPTIPPAECAVSGHDPVSLEDKLSQAPSQVMTEPGSDDKTLVQSVTNVVSMDSPHGHIVASEGEMVQNSNPDPPIPPVEFAVPGPGHNSISSQEKQSQPSSQLMSETSSDVKTLNQSISNVEGEQGRLPISFMSPPTMEGMESNQNFLPFEGEMATSLDTSAQTSSDVESERTNGKPKNKLPRPRNPLIDAVAAHDKSKLRRVTERVMPQIAPKVDERDSLLEQIRTKSFNLKPAVTTRPSIQGPKTNLKLAAILEKANAIRQALAGSDEDDDADWSDS